MCLSIDKELTKKDKLNKTITVYKSLCISSSSELITPYEYYSVKAGGTIKPKKTLKSFRHLKQVNGEGIHVYRDKKHTLLDDKIYKDEYDSNLVLQLEVSTKDLIGSGTFSNTDDSAALKTLTITKEVVAAAIMHKLSLCPANVYIRNYIKKRLEQ